MKVNANIWGQVLQSCIFYPLHHPADRRVVDTEVLCDLLHGVPVGYMGFIDPLIPL